MNYSLDKSARKYVCPRCGKRRFVLYLDENGQKLHDSVGRCDRQDHCRYHYPPREYFRDNAHLRDNRDWRREPPRPAPVPPTRMPSYLDPSRLNDSLKINRMLNPLFTSLLGLLAPYVSRERLDYLFTTYGVGTSAGATEFFAEFFQVDRHCKIRTGKKMGYDHNAHRNGNINWIHREEGYDRKYRLRQCFFGEHLLADNDTEIWIFESEKTVLVLAAATGWNFGTSPFTAIACGGCGGLNPKPEAFADPWSPYAVLRNRRVVLFPDEGKFDEWYAKGELLLKYCREVSIAALGAPPDFEGEDIHPAPECIETGMDLADAILADTSAGRDPGRILCHRYPITPSLQAPPPPR